MNEEQTWVAQAQQGDDEAFTKLVETYQTPVFNLCYRMLGEPELAEDAAQETFLRAYQHLHRYDQKRPFPTWLLSIAAHYCIDRLRRRKLFAFGAALTVALSLIVFSMSPGWPVLVAAFVVYGCGVGCFSAVDIALVTQVLPSQRDAGKDLGVINLANTLPQALAPALAVWSLGPTHGDFRMFFLVASGLALAGGLAILPIRGVR